MLKCFRCQAVLPPDTIGTSDMTVCPSCKLRFQLVVFPAFLKESRPISSIDILPNQNEASCYNHPGKKAETICSVCGKFLCALCDIEWENHHYCPSCLAIQKQNIMAFDTQRIRYDKISLFLAVFPIFFVFLTIITAPVALYIGIRYWKRPSSIVQQVRPRFFIAILLSSLQIIAWIYIFILYLSDI